LQRLVDAAARFDHIRGVGAVRQSSSSPQNPRAALRAALAAACAACALAAGATEALPSVASINLCADQLVLTIAAPEQVLTVSWLAADPEESLLADAAARYPLNYGSAEEILQFDPDVVIAGSYTNAFTRALLARLGYPVIELEPETTIAEIEANVQRVGAALGRPERGAQLVAQMRADVQRLRSGQPQHAPAAVVVRPGGFTVGDRSLAHDLMMLAGVRNVAAEQGLDRWGSLSMETLLRAAPDLIVLTGYRATQPSIANAVLAHPALARLRDTRPTTTIRAAYWACGLPQSFESAELLQRAARR
jgi:iron complex transport system substrate-binding protein